MTYEGQMHDFVVLLVALALKIGPIAGPFIALIIVVSLLKWANGQARGPGSGKDIAESIDDSISGLGNRSYYGRSGANSYYALRKSGYSNRQLRDGRQYSSRYVGKPGSRQPRS